MPFHTISTLNAKNQPDIDMQVREDTLLYIQAAKPNQMGRSVINFAGPGGAVNWSEAVQDTLDRLLERFSFLKTATAYDTVHGVPGEPIAFNPGRVIRVVRHAKHVTMLLDNGNELHVMEVPEFLQNGA